MWTHQTKMPTLSSWSLKWIHSKFLAHEYSMTARLVPPHWVTLSWLFVHFGDRSVNLYCTGYKVPGLLLQPQRLDNSQHRESHSQHRESQPAHWSISEQNYRHTHKIMWTTMEVGCGLQDFLKDMMSAMQWDFCYRTTTVLTVWSKSQCCLLLW